MRRALLVPLLVIAGMLLPGWVLAAPDSDALLDLLRGAQFTPLTHVGELPLPVLRVCLNHPEEVDELIKAAAASKTQFWRELGRYH